MFIAPRDTGWLEVIAGPMFSGKTEELIRRLRLAMYARQRVVVFKPALDDRFSSSEIVSRNQMKLESISCADTSEILQISESKDVVGIDEAQFFDESIVEIAERLAAMKKRVIIAGLDLDFRAVPFDNVSRLMASAEYVTKTLAICMQCGNPASRSQRLAGKGSERIVVGDVESYEARCRRCFSPDPH
ncbi:thymidine kinase [Myxococcota bacterium]|nr:thymidine kinase [Myxococcota bacterium]MBU1382311.1 thymidine kinase [Myxococcota bacterium]MBU1498457.1 thymidine kinase [Myxococcota bacterium]